MLVRLICLIDDQFLRRAPVYLSTASRISILTEARDSSPYSDTTDRFEFRRDESTFAPSGEPAADANN